jgi:crossover junction endodeoxyribonuclease RuvC
VNKASASVIKVLGIDPGLAGTGIGIIQGSHKEILAYAFGSISTKAKEDVSFRLHKIYSETVNIIREQKPDIVIIEDIYSLAKYPGSGIMLGKVSGVIILAAHEAGLKIEEIPVREAKKIVSGNGDADKYQVERAIRHQLNHSKPIRPFHASDALGLALTGYYRHKHIL